MSRRGLLLAALVVSACGGRSVGVDESRARAHIDTLAGAIGSRPLGSAANARARAYLIDELTRDGMRVRVQEADAVDASRGVTAHVFNILAWRDGTERDAIALVSHYDSVPQASGALDDALGVATCVESARALATSPLRHSLLLLLTDGEEAGLMGARAAVTDPEVAGRVRAFLNFDGTGAAGPPVLFEAGPGLGAPLAAWARGAAAPVGGSFAAEIFRRLPNDTDFTVLKALGASGLNFAPVGDSYAYHNDRDRPDRVSAATLRSEIVNTVTTVRALDDMTLGSSDEMPTYFDVLHWRGVVYGVAMARAITIAACLVASIAWLFLTLSGYRARGVAGLLLTIAWHIVIAAAVFGAMVGAARLLQTMRGLLNPWYAKPSALLALLLAAAATIGWLATRLAASVPDRARPWRSPLAVWWTTLPAWIAVAVLLHLEAPVASFLVTLPLGVAGLLLAPSRRGVVSIRVISLAILAVSAAFWAENVWRLFGFLVPLSGWLGVALPVWALPALVATGLLMLAPPIAAMIASRRQQARASVVSAYMFGVLIATGATALSVPAYTDDRPERRDVRYIQDDLKGEARWEVSGTERDANRASSARLVSVAPATARARTTRVSDGSLQIDIDITSRDAWILRVMLPSGVTPIRSSLAGQVRGGVWTATMASPPPQFSVQLQLAAGASEVEATPAVVNLTTLGVPGGQGPNGLPPWLSAERSTWTARSIFVIPVTADRR